MKLKKYLGIILAGALALWVVGCSSADTNEPKDEGVAKVEDKNKKEAIVLSNDEMNEAIETIKLMTEDSAYDSSDIKLITEQQEEFTTTNNVLKVIVIKPEEDVINYYKESVPEVDLKESIKKSLTLDTAVSTVSESNDKITDFDRIVAVLYDNEEDYNNDNSYAVDVLDIN